MRFVVLLLLFQCAHPPRPRPQLEPSPAPAQPTPPPAPPAPELGVVLQQALTEDQDFRCQYVKAENILYCFTLEQWEQLTREGQHQL